MRSVSTLLLAAVGFACVARVSAQPALLQAIADREAEVNNLAAGAESLLSGSAPCTTARRECSDCTVDACRTDQSELVGNGCDSTASTPSGCGGTGTRQSLTESVVRVADEVAPTLTASSELSKPRNAREDICASKELDRTFAENRVNNVAGSNTLKNQYFGTAQGVFRNYPGRVWSFDGSGCAPYDPRERPWYVAAASGAKRLVLILDVSGSMGAASQTGSRLNTAIQAAVSVIETLTSADYAQVVLFSTNANSQGTNLLQVTAENQRTLLNYVTSLRGGGSTNYIAAFDKAYDIFRNSRTSERGASACRSVVLFLTDGRPNDSTGTTVQNGLTSFMAEADSNNEELTVFTYSLGPDADTSADLRTVPQALACIGRGVWAPITSNVNLRSSMVQYYTFLANGLQRDEPVWVEPYFDATGLGTLVTTASKAVYDKTVSPPQFLGVVGVDVVLDEFNQLASNSEALLNALVSRSQTCTASNITDCDLQRLRGNWPCPAPAPTVSSCPASGSNTCNIPLPTTDVDPRCPGAFLTSDETQYRELQCCELASASSDDDGSGVGAGVVIGIVAGVAVLVVVVAAVVYKAKSAKSKPPKAAAPSPAPAPAAAAPAPPAASNLSYYNNAGANTSTAPYGGAQNSVAYPPSGGGYPPSGAYPGSPPGPTYGGGNTNYPPAPGQPATTGYV